MADVVGVDGRRRDPLEEAIRLSFQRHGAALVTVAQLEVSIGMWRLTACQAARSLGRPVQTFHVDDTVYAFLTDWPRDDHERALRDQAVREAMQSAAQR